MTPVLCGLFKLLSSDSLGTEYVTITQVMRICYGITVVTYSVPRDSELRRLNKPHYTGVITLQLDT
jgi:hypothetical protein